MAAVILPYQSEGRMPDFAASAALWGLAGGAGYSGTRLTTALWGGSEITPRARRLAWAQFGIALFLAPFAAEGLTPLAMSFFPTATLAPAAFLIGLSFNAIWPVVMEPAFIRRLVADVARGIADRLSPGSNL